jgi:hypothetical protein
MSGRTLAASTALAALIVSTGAAAAQDLTNAPAAPVTCTIAERSNFLPEAVRETSGLARGLHSPDTFWTHNDSGSGAEIFALDANGEVLRSVKVRGVKAVDWEDIESGPCDDGHCLYIADIGDNDRARSTITIYRIPEPAASVGEVSPTTITMRYEDGPQDAESVFVLPSREIFVVTKGRHAGIALYRLDAAAGSEGGTLVKVRDLFPQPSDENDRVTAATSSPDGEWVAIRTYRHLYLYPAQALVTNRSVTPVTLDLSPLAQIQGESVAITADGSIWLTSEAEDKRAMPTWSKLSCRFPAAPAPAPGS